MVKWDEEVFPENAFAIASRRNISWKCIVRAMRLLITRSSYSDGFHFLRYIILYLFLGQAHHQKVKIVERFKILKISIHSLTAYGPFGGFLIYFHAYTFTFLSHFWNPSPINNGKNFFDGRRFAWFQSQKIQNGSRPGIQCHCRKGRQLPATSIKPYNRKCG